MAFPGFRLQNREDLQSLNTDATLTDATLIERRVDPVVPESLRPMLDKATTEEATTLLMSVLEPVSADLVDGESTYDKANPMKTPNLEAALRCTSWGSGGGLGMFGGQLFRFKKVEQTEFLTEFFQEVFSAVQQAIPGAVFSRTNLFHGHAVFDRVEDGADFRIVFHAYEYPTDLYPIKVAQAGRLGGDPDPFESSEEKFYKRNAIWSMRNSTVYIPNYYDWAAFGEDPMLGNYPSLVTERTCTIDQTRVGVEMITLNYFPKESVRLFLKQ